MANWKFWQKRAAPVEAAVSAKHSPRQMRMFTAANTPIIEGWTAKPTSIDVIIRNDLSKLVARSREQAINNPYFKRFFTLLRSNIVGPYGFTFQSMALDDRGKPDVMDRKAVEKAWKKWTKAVYCDYEQQLNFRDMLRLAVDSLGRDGEIILRHHFDNDNPFGYSVSLMDGAMLPVDHCVSDTDSGNYIRFSIEFDSRNRAVAYYFVTTSRTTYDYQWGGRNFVRIPATEITHVFIREHVGQKRGIPWGATALMRAKMLDGYEETALVAARVGAAKMGFLGNKNGVDNYTGDKRDADGNVVTTVDPGTIEFIGDMEFIPFDPKYPDAQFEIFCKQVLRGISAAFNISYHSVSQNLEGVNYTSSRSGELQDREVYKYIQDFIIESVLEPIKDKWLQFALLKGAITSETGARLPVSKYTKYQEVKFQGRRWPWVDPASDMQADALAIENKLMSRAEIIRERGREPEEVWAELEAEEKRFGAVQKEPVSATPSQDAKKNSKQPKEDTENAEDE